MLTIRRQAGRGLLRPAGFNTLRDHRERSCSWPANDGSRQFKTYRPANASHTIPQSPKHEDRSHPLIKKHNIQSQPLIDFLNWKPAVRSKPTLNLPELDQKWKAIWEEPRTKYAEVVDGDRSHVDWIENKKGEKSIVPMFPYPSGDLHLGHLRVYTISDVLARFQEAKGWNVVHPIAWDAFGLPAENAAIERGVDPATWTYQNIEKMRDQLDSMNCSWDWDREFETCDPAFYKHTQKLFLMLHARGLAYQEESLVNYDPVDQTVLANEQVDSNGKSWRSGAQVEKRMLKQWFFKISDYRQELLDDLDILAKDDRWPERVIAMQRNWIGKSQGAKIKFKLNASDNGSSPHVQVFTTRPDTLYGVQYLALAATHPLVEKTAKIDKRLQAFLAELPNLPADSKEGYLLPNVRASNPLAFYKESPDATKASLPIYVAPYVLAEYGEGAVMGVPGHDTRDYAFWKHNHPADPVRMVVSASPKETTKAPNGPFTHEGHLNSCSGPHAGLSSTKATEGIIKLLTANSLAESAVTWRLRDWLISRQRYWGTPIPIIHCQSCGPVPVPDHDLPVVLPQVEEHWTKGKSGNPLEHAHDWINTSCPKCGQAAKRDTDTMDTFVDSSWYFMRYADVENEQMMIRPDAFNPVDIYVGGVEHAILHLLYTRFIFKFLATTDYWPEGRNNNGEPITKLITQGMVHGKTYSDPSSGRFLKPGEVEMSKSGPVITATGEYPLVSYEKMSKSKYNGVDPSTCISKYGADATRAHILFQAPVSEVLEWDEEKISGVTRWMRRLYDHLYEWHNQAGFLAGDIEYRLTRPRTHAYGIRSSKLAFFRTNVPQAVLNLRHTTPKDYFVNYASEQDLASSLEPGYRPCHPGSLELYSLVEKGKILDYVSNDPTTAEVPERLKVVEDLGKQGNRESKKLWRAVQKTIRSTTASYENGYSLNTVISDLMSLTNVMIDYPGGELGPQDRWIHFHAAMNLIKMMAPVCPAFADECWSLITYRKPTWRERAFMGIATRGFSTTGAPYHHSLVREWPYPEEDGTLEMLTDDTLTCSVQINGKLKCVVELDKPDSSLRGQAVHDWIVSEVLSSPEWKEKVGQKVDVSAAKKVIVVKGGKLVNFVL